ncbi:hypothetical protein [Erythrobacter sp. MTPC3]|uniref:hypothetical protein n=1 Tax=Erythrobacter sp. MTPC3 TaxID=3056564 RepID=UPI0036F4364D
MDELIDKVENRRKAEGLSQSGLASVFEVSQGHYSKVSGGLVPAGKKLRLRMNEWLSGPTIRSRPVSELEELAKSIQRDTRRLMQLLRN